MGNKDLRTAFKQSINCMDDDVDWVATTNLDDPSSEMTGYESFDVVLHLNTTDTQIAREIVGDAGEKIKDRDDWDGKLLFETIWEGSPEIEMRVRVYLTSEARQNGSGAELYF